MDDLLAGMKATFDALTAAPAVTFTSFVARRFVPETGSGKTTGRFVFIEAPTLAMRVEGAGDLVARVSASVRIEVVWPAPTVADADDYLLGWQVLDQLWSAIKAGSPKRTYTYDTRRFAVMTRVDVQQGIGRPPWARQVDHYLCRGVFDVEEDS